MSTVKDSLQQYDNEKAYASVEYLDCDFSNPDIIDPLNMLDSRIR